MEFVIAFNVAVTIAWWTGASFTVLSLFCIAFMVWLRRYSDSIKKRRAAVMQKWEETLFEATTLSVADYFADYFSDEAAGVSSGAPEIALDIKQKLDRRDLPYFLYEWNYLHESLAGDSKKGLNLLAQKLNLSEMTLKLLKSPFLDQRLLAINTLGNLGKDETYAEIEKMLALRDPVISSWAWRALFRINTARTLEKHLRLIAGREDWSPIFVAKVLREIEADTLSKPLSQLAEECYAAKLKERQMSRLISYLVLAHTSDYNVLINRILLETNELEIIIACLRLVNSDDDLTRIRALLRDERWEIRMHVVLTLARLGHPEDIDLLIEALDDSDWWVRYRAANSMFSMPGMTGEKIEELSNALPNQFSRDILRQVLTEMRLLCNTQTSFTLSR